MSTNQTKRVIIIGGGFAGLNAAKALGNRDGIKVTIIDRRNHHLFQPLLYQVAMAAISPADISVPIRAVVSKYKNIDVVLGNVHDVNFQERKILGDFGEREYDNLILACGANHSYFGNDHWEEQAPGLKSLEEALEIRRRMLMAFELAERETEWQIRDELLTFVIVGGGPTGVELAGAIGEISQFTLGKDFRTIDPRKCKILLVEGGDRVLPAFDPKLSASADASLRKLGVEVITNSFVTDITKEGVRIGDQFVRARTVIWAAGVQPSRLTQALKLAKDRAGRIIVRDDLSVEGHPEVFVLGDQAAFTQEGETLPGLASVAIQQGKCAAKSIINESKGKPRLKFSYWNKGIMATIGRAAAVVELPKLKFSGFFAWVSWLLVHVLLLISFRNRMSVFLQWLWSYVTVRRGARLITSRHWRTDKRSEQVSRYIELTKIKKRRKAVAKKKTAGKKAAAKKR